MKKKLKIETNDFEIELKEYDVDELKNLIDQLSQHKLAEKSLCPKLDEWLIQQKKLPFTTILDALVQLSRWCHTNGGAYGNYKSVAEEISKFIFINKLPDLREVP